MRFTPEHLAVMLRHALDEYPRECVGAVIGADGEHGRFEIIKLKNVQDEMLRAAPANFDRDSRTGYFVDPREVLNLANRARNEKKKIIAFYHSHPDHECYFSDVDFAGAVMFGEPVYPGAVYVVISVFAGKAKSAEVFAWDGKTFSFSEKLPIVDA